MKTIKILGTGCPNCQRTEAVIRTAISRLNLTVAIEKVEDIEAIMKYDVLSTPAVVIDEQVCIKGRVPSLDEMSQLLMAQCCNETDTSCCEPAETTDNSGCCGSHNHGSCC